MKKIVRVPTRCAIAMAVGLAIASPSVYGAGLGRISVKSALGQPLRAEVEVTSVSRDEAASLAVRLASAAAFRQANLEMNPALTGLRVNLERRGDNGYLVRLASPMPVNEPFLDLLLELTSNNGRVLREYTILLDPPALRAQPDVIAPATPARPPTPTQAAASAAPAPAPAPSAPAAASAAAPAVSGSSASGSTYTVQRGDTLGAIAEKTRHPNTSLDQMLVGLFRANPDAFQEQNMNLLRSGSVLKVPSASELGSLDSSAARREVVAQSADFARYRSRLAQATGSAVPQGSSAVGTGQVSARVQDGSASATGGDQLKIGQGTAATKATDEAVARDRAIQELQARVQELERTNAQLQKALELQNKAGAQAQSAAEAKAGTTPTAPAPTVAAATPAPAPSPAASAPPAPVAAAPAPAPAPVPAPASSTAAPTAATPAKAAAAAPAPVEEPGFFSDAMLPIVGGIAALIAALGGVLLMRRRKSKGEGEDYDAMSEAARGNSLFGQTGGRSVDTGAASSFNSSFIPAASQMDSTEVDPVAEADVYIAYGREEQAEDILKESLRNNPDRHAARVKLMEILARRGDKAAFAAMATDLKARTGGEGEDWDRAIAMGRSLDPTHPLFAGAIAAETTSRGPTTEIRFGPTTRGTPTSGGFKAPPATLGGDETADSVLDFSTTAMRDPVLPGEKEAASASDSLMPQDSRLGIETLLPVDASNSSMPHADETAASKYAAAAAAQTPDLSDLEFEALNTMPPTRLADEDDMTPAAQPMEAMDFKLDPMPTPAATPFRAMPDLDLNLPPVEAPAPQEELVGGFDFAPTRGGRPSRIDAGPASGFGDTMTGVRRSNLPPLEDALSRPSLLGDLGALPEESATRLASNTDQATVPLIDFDLSGADAPLTGSGRSATPTGSPMASQMATKLDLARGYIDLGVKDGARELLEEVMRDGTREQRQEAVELLKQAER